ncbi:MAG: hypothetical protein HYV07_21630 [Deltaproteobacteria bacterium]|nr:hypothetical protein [Deltaproteobacteria bacterium]
MTSIAASPVRPFNAFASNLAVEPRESSILRSVVDGALGHPAWNRFSGSAGSAATSLNPDQGPLMDPMATTQLGLDVAGIFDPTPLSDGVSMALSLADGDLTGAALSGVSMVPYAGDAFAKPVKLLRTVARSYPWMETLEPDQLKRTLESFRATKSPENLAKALRSLGNVNEATNRAEPAARERAEKLGLPLEGPMTFAPPATFGNAESRGRRGGVLDAFGNEWVAPRKAAVDPAFRVFLERPSGLSNFASPDGTVYVDRAGVILQPERPADVGQPAAFERPVTPIRG